MVKKEREDVKKKKGNAREVEELGKNKNKNKRGKGKKKENNRKRSRNNDDLVILAKRHKI